MNDLGSHVMHGVIREYVEYNNCNKLVPTLNISIILSILPTFCTFV